MNADTAAFIREHLRDDVGQLALRLGGRDDAPFILRQVEAWQRLRHKVPSWVAVDELHYPPRLALEQCSGEEAAIYKYAIVQRLFPGGGGVFADLTGGLGVDFSFIARHFRQAVYVERDAALCALARHNFPLLGLEKAEIVQAEAGEYLQSLTGEGRLDLVVLDPARRDVAGRKVAALGDCSPDVAGLWGSLQERARCVMLKLSPMLDITELLRQLPGVGEVHVVGSGGECKELVCVADFRTGLSLACDEVAITCCDTRFSFAFTRQEERAATPRYATGVGRYVYDPSPVLLKAGPWNLVAARYGVEKLAPLAHLYTSDTLVENFPGRTFRVATVTGCGRRDTARLSGTSANLAVRGFPATVAELRKRWRLGEGGDRFLFATVSATGEKLLINAARHIP
ncbi:MAG: SAM-dependent methyltransferase [Bacteroidaceae bacterium]|nr:SAM-dependent methyltransferase [Bacteroidaceae bacterium]